MEPLAILSANIQDIFKALKDFVVIKMFASWGMVFIFYMVGAKHIPYLTALTALVAIDFVTGVYAAKKTGEEIKSKKMVRTAIKWTFYMLMISAAHLTETLVDFDSYLGQVTIAFLGATELVSILENIGKIGIAIPKKLLNKIEDFRDSQ